MTSFCVFSKQQQCLSNKIVWFWIIFFTLFRGLRWGVGTDWEQYLDVFSIADWSNIFSLQRYEYRDDVMDFGYMILNVVVKSI